MGYFLAALGAYLLGCSNLAFYISKVRKVDIRAGGSGNLGASNAVVLLGWKAGAITAVHDVGKAVLAVLIARWLLPDSDFAPAAAGVSCVLGHIFPFWLKFKGGKGVVTAAMSILMCNPYVFIIILLLFIAIVAMTKYIL